MNNAPEMISVPKDSLDDLESGFLQLWFMVDRVAAQIEKGAAAQPLARVLRQEVNAALTTLHKWRLARWGSQGLGQQQS